MRIRQEVGPELMLPAVLRSLRGLPAAAGIVAGDVVAVTQSSTTRELAERLGSLPVGIGIGLVRAGLAGAHEPP